MEQEISEQSKMNYENINIENEKDNNIQENYIAKEQTLNNNKNNNKKSNTTKQNNNKNNKNYSTTKQNINNKIQDKNNKNYNKKEGQNRINQIYKKNYTKTQSNSKNKNNNQNYQEYSSEEKSNVKNCHKNDYTNSFAKNTASATTRIKNISTRTKSMRLNASLEKVYNNNNDFVKKKLEKLEKLKEQKEKNEKQTCTFSPDIHKSLKKSKSYTQKDFDNFYKKVIKWKHNINRTNEHKIILQIKKIEEECKFRPTISEKAHLQLMKEIKEHRNNACYIYDKNEEWFKKCNENRLQKELEKVEEIRKCQEELKIKNRKIYDRVMKGRNINKINNINSDNSSYNKNNSSFSNPHITSNSIMKGIRNKNTNTNNSLYQDINQIIKLIEELTYTVNANYKIKTDDDNNYYMNYISNRINCYNTTNNMNNTKNSFNNHTYRDNLKEKYYLKTFNFDYCNNKNYCLNNSRNIYNNNESNKSSHKNDTWANYNNDNISYEETNEKYKLLMKKYYKEKEQSKENTN